MLTILWNPDVVAFHLGPFTMRWYSLMWLIGLVGAYLMVQYLFKKEKIEQEKFEPLFIYCFIGILVGARLGHCLFYEPAQYLGSWQGFIEMLLPIRQTAEGWKFVGYEGLASHGGTLGLMIALWLYVRKTGIKLMRVLDMIAIATPITACCIRLGNLMNSEIIGTPTDVPWAFIFERVDMLPRHPGQLYEAIAYFCFFFVGWFFYRMHNSQFTIHNERQNNCALRIVHCAFKIGSGFFFGLCLTLIFTFRFFIEYTKDIQVSFEQGMLFNMGQLLSLPFIALGSYCMYRAKGKD